MLKRGVWLGHPCFSVLFGTILCFSFLIYFIDIANKESFPLAFLSGTFGGSKTSHIVAIEEDLADIVSRLPPNTSQELAALLAPLVASLQNATEHLANNETVRKGAIVADDLVQAGFDLAVVSRLLSNVSNRHFRFALAGGSISAGHGLEKGQEFFSVFSSKMSEIMTPLNLSATYTNAAVSATDSSYFAACMYKWLDVRQFDFIFLEFSTNDVMCGTSIEDLVRSIWRRNPTIHIVYLQLSFPMDIFLANHYTENVVNGSTKPRPKDFSTPHFLNVAKYYKIGFITLDQYFFNLGYDREMTLAERENASASYGIIWKDPHPNATIHEFIADVILSYFTKSLQQIAVKLLNNDSVAAVVDTRKAQLNRATIGAPLFASSWMDMSDCFFLKNTAMHLFANNSGLKLLPNVTVPKMSFGIDKGFSSETKCSKGFIPRLAFAYSTHGFFKQGRLLPAQFYVGATFQFQDRPISDNYVFDVAAISMDVRVVQFLLPKTFPLPANYFLKAPNNWGIEGFLVPQLNPFSHYAKDDCESRLFCSEKSNAQLESLEVEITPHVNDSLFQFVPNTIIVSYDCCH